MQKYLIFEPNFLKDISVNLGFQNNFAYSNTYRSSKINYEIRYSFFIIRDAFKHFVAHLRNSFLHIFCVGSFNDDGARHHQIFKNQKKRLGDFRTFLSVFRDLEYRDDRLVVRLKKS